MSANKSTAQVWVPREVRLPGQRLAHVVVQEGGDYLRKPDGTIRKFKSFSRANSFAVVLSAGIGSSKEGGDGA